MEVAEARAVNVIIPSANPVTVRDLQQGIEQALSKFKDIQGLIYINVENLYSPPVGKHHGSHHLGRDRSRSRSRSRSHSRGHSRSRSNSGHRKGNKHQRGRHHSRGRRDDYYYHESRYQSAIQDASDNNTGAEGTEVETVPPCWGMWEKTRWGGRGRHGKHRRNKSNTEDKQPVTTSEIVDLTDKEKDNAGKSTEKDLQEKFNNMDVHSP